MATIYVRDTRIGDAVHAKGLDPVALKNGLQWPVQAVGVIVSRVVFPDGAVTLEVQGAGPFTRRVHMRPHDAVEGIARL